jgi:phosphoserine aminotransferase
MIPMNLLPPDRSADYIVTGSWGKRPSRKRSVGSVNIAATTADGGFTRTPAQDEIKLDSHAAYVHFTTNETIEGVEFKQEPDAGGVPLIADASSDILSRPIDAEKYALIYAGAQKNMGPSGVTLVIIRDDLLKRIPDNLHTMLDYRTHVEADSLYNTPNTFGIYIINLVCKWLKKKADCARCSKKTKRRPNCFTMRLTRAALSRPRRREFALDDERHIPFAFGRFRKQFAKEATAAKLDGLKGHRSVGGLRASIYNAFPREGVEALVSFMQEFERKNG